MSFISAIWTPVKSEQLQEDAPHYDPGNILRILLWLELWGDWRWRRQEMIKQENVWQGLQPFSTCHVPRQISNKQA